MVLSHIHIHVGGAGWEHSGAGAGVGTGSRYYRRVDKEARYLQDINNVVVVHEGNHDAEYNFTF